VRFAGAVVIFAVLCASASAGGFEGPTTIAAGYGGVWVGTGRGDVIRIDPASGRVRERFERIVSPSSVSGLVAAYGSVWVGGSSRPLARLDLSAGRIEEVPAHGVRTAGPGPMAAGAGSVWSGDWHLDRVFRIGPRSGRVVASAPVPGRIANVAAGRAGAYVVYAPRGIAGPRVLRRLDPRTARPTGSTARFRCDIGVAVGATALWTVDYCTWTLARRDPRTLAVRAERPSPRLATNVLLAHGSVWVLGGARLLRIDARSLRTTRQLSVRAAAAAASDRAVWLLDFGDGRVGTVRRLDPATNRIVAAVRLR
jgi:hypothetical protein